MASQGHDDTSQRVDVWYVDLDGDQDWRSCAPVLSEDERARADRFHSAVHHRRFVACRAALRSILAREVDADPATLHFHDGPYGKPELADNHRDVRFNLSHAGGNAVIAVCRHFEVGVDIEPLRPVHDLERVAKIVFSDAELGQLAEAGDKNRAFLNGWTRKEAYIKALGTGFSEPLRAFSVSLAEPAALVAAGACGGDVSAWTLLDLEHAGHVVALAARTPGAKVHVRDR
jgi:4'-phosphopantetheinyl transferase